jgi:hypothetical protein
MIRLGKDLNRYQKTYPFIRLQPKYEQITESTGSGGGTITENAGSLFGSLNDDVFYKKDFLFSGWTEPFGLYVGVVNDNLYYDNISNGDQLTTNPAIVDLNNLGDIVLLENGTINHLRDLFFNVDQITGDAIFDYNNN